MEDDVISEEADRRLIMEVIITLPHDISTAMTLPWYVSRIAIQPYSHVFRNL